MVEILMVFVKQDISALSAFRTTKLLQQLQKIHPGVRNLSAEYVHFVVTDTDPTVTEEKALHKLLTYGSPYTGSRAGETFLVLPRAGTISPWSSKATDIARNCGLQDIRRIERGVMYYVETDNLHDRKSLSAPLHDRMTELVLDSIDAAEGLFAQQDAKPLVTINVLSDGAEALRTANTNLGMALAADEIDYLVDAYKTLDRNPTDAELMMFAQVNSEHCRHKIFNADWIIDGQKQPKSLFKMIRNTYEKGGQNVLSAYSDNAAVLRGSEAESFFADPETGVYGTKNEPVHIVTKVETHNHPTAIAPFPGAATGVGGEIRDEAATGRGAKTKMGLSGFSVSNLKIPGAMQPWEVDYGKPGRIASSFNIMIDAPLGGAAFNNEFGRVNLAGYFRTYEQADENNQIWGYHKPIMLAGGTGNIRDENVHKKTLPVGAKIIVLGGPSMLIGLGGGSGASMNSGESLEDLDFASVQRGSAEMQRRAQEVISRLASMGDDNPIITIHDVGAGGWSNALPELVHDSGRGALFELRNLPNADLGMSPMEIWCNESQERYVLGILAKDVPLFTDICKRERCPFAIVGTATEEEHITVTDSLLGTKPIDLPMPVLFGKPPKMTRTVTRKTTKHAPLSTGSIDLAEAVERVFHLPAVGSKKFLITIGDRTVGGLTVRDPLVGPWQTPVSDVAVTASSFGSKTGEAMTIGERAPVALINAPASARLAVGEAITNIVAASIGDIKDVKLSANWMAAVGFGQEDEKLFDTVKAVGEEFCPALGITIPVGKDSLSMRSVWEQNGKDISVVGPLSLVITAFAPVTDTSRVLTPQLVRDVNSELLLIDLGLAKNRLGGSALAQVFNQIGNESPDADPTLLKSFFSVIQKLKRDGALLAYHDRSDGGLLVTVAEMMFAGRCGVDITVSDGDVLPQLFSEELGAVIQINSDDADQVIQELETALGPIVYRIGKPTDTQELSITHGPEILYRQSRKQLEKWWADTSYQMQAARDNANCAREEYDAIGDEEDPGLSPISTFSFSNKIYGTRPKVAIFREEGVNGQVEMAAVFSRAGFTAVDVHLNDLVSGNHDLREFVGLAACGGFSYGDVLGAGEGWAKSILLNPSLRAMFKEFFHRPNTFSLGVCNGCQMLSNLKELIPGAEDWPIFLRNESEQFEARVATVRVNESPSIMFKDMVGSYLPIPVAHGEGQAHFENEQAAAMALQNNVVPLQYTDNYHKVTEQYPFNPNGSTQGITSLTTPDGRATILMPHPERAFLTVQYSWHPDNWGENGPWFKIFQNARDWVAQANKRT